MMKNIYDVDAKELLELSRIPVSVYDDETDIYVDFALEMISEIVNNNKINKRTVLICPCGPVGQYKIFAKLVNTLKISLKNTWIINMDEYITEDGDLITIDDKFSFRKCMNEELYSNINEDLIMPVEQRIFPDPHNLDYIPKLIEELGGVDISFGGVALNGHVAFNEPQPELTNEEFAQLSVRTVKLSAETLIKDAILSRGGAVETVPKTAVTIGMKEIFSARKIRLSMMNQMQRAVVRRACLCEANSNCPVSFLQNHPDAGLYVLRTVTEKPF